MSHIAECRKYLKEKLLNRPLEGYDKERAKLSRLARETIESGKSHSVLVVGASGTGKTMMVQSVLNEIKSIKEYDNRYCIIELHGLLHTDNNLAFSDSLYQMNVENDSPADSDPKRTLVRILNEENENSKSYIFVLEDFHVFCDYDFLFVLLDSAQAKEVPMLVVGVTTFFNTYESLEKRVMSRFTGNRINLAPECTFENFVSKFTKMLTLEKSACLNSSFTEILTMEKNASTNISYVESWNKNIKKLSSDLAVKDIMKKLFTLSRNNERVFSNFMFYSISQISEKNPYLTQRNLQTAFEMLRAENKSCLLKSLSILELCLIIAAHHHVEIYNGEPFNFEMIYQRYHKFARVTPNITNVQRQMAYQTFETLVKLKLIAPFSSTGTKTVPREYIFHRLLITKQQINEAIRTYPNLAVDILYWAENIC